MDHMSPRPTMSAQWGSLVIISLSHLINLFSTWLVLVNRANGRLFKVIASFIWEQVKVCFDILYVLLTSKLWGQEVFFFSFLLWAHCVLLIGGNIWSLITSYWVDYTWCDEFLKDHQILCKLSFSKASKFNLLVYGILKGTKIPLVKISFLEQTLAFVLSML